MFHGITITDKALSASVTLSSRYINDRFLPDKAIDLIDEAASRKRIEIDSKPDSLDEIDRRIMQLEIEKKVLKKENNKLSDDRLLKVEDDDLVLTASNLNVEIKTSIKLKQKVVGQHATTISAQKLLEISLEGSVG